MSDDTVHLDSIVSRLKNSYLSLKELLIAVTTARNVAEEKLEMAETYVAQLLADRALFKEELNSRDKASVAVMTKTVSLIEDIADDIGRGDCSNNCTNYLDPDTRAQVKRKKIAVQAELETLVEETRQRSFQQKKQHEQGKPRGDFWLNEISAYVFKGTDIPYENKPVDPRRDRYVSTTPKTINKDALYVGALAQAMARNRVASLELGSVLGSPCSSQVSSMLEANENRQYKCAIGYCPCKHIQSESNKPCPHSKEVTATRAKEMGMLLKRSIATNNSFAKLWMDGMSDEDEDGSDDSGSIDGCYVSSVATKSENPDYGKQGEDRDEKDLKGKSPEVSDADDNSAALGNGNSAAQFVPDDTRRADDTKANSSSDCLVA